MAVLCDPSSQFIFTLEPAPQRLNLLGSWHIGVVQHLLRLLVFAAARNDKLCQYGPRVLGNDGPHVTLHPQLVTDVS